MNPPKSQTGPTGPTPDAAPQSGAQTLRPATQIAMGRRPDYPAAAGIAMGGPAATGPLARCPTRGCPWRWAHGQDRPCPWHEDVDELAALARIGHGAEEIR